MKTTTLNLKMNDEALGLERLFGAMRRRCVHLQSARVERHGDALLVSLVMEEHLEATARALLPRVPEVREVLELQPQGFWNQFGMTGV